MGTVPVAASLVLSIIRDLRAGRMGVDAVALLSMLGALALGETLAGELSPSCMPVVARWRISRSGGPSGI